MSQKKINLQRLPYPCEFLMNYTDNPTLENLIWYKVYIQLLKMKNIKHIQGYEN